MKKITTLTLLLGLFCSNLVAQYDYKNYSKSGPDSKGEVMAIYFDYFDSKCKIWRLSDGELLYNDTKTAFGYASKMLRYKIQEINFKGRDVSYSKATIRDSKQQFDNYHVKYGDDYLTSFATNVKPIGFVGPLYYDIDNKITLFYEVTNELTTLYNVIPRSSPKFDSKNKSKIIKKYKNMQMILERKDLNSGALLYPVISPTGKYVFYPYYGVLLSLEKNKELWNITQNEGRENPYFDVAFSVDETEIAISNKKTAPNSIYIYEVKNGKKLKELSVPETLQNRLNIEKIHPASDMKSYIVEGVDKNEKKAECWLVKADGTTQLLKME